MELPFTQSQFFEVFARYNTAIEPAQIAAALMGWISAIVAWQARGWRARQLLLVLAVFWAINGALYHLTYFAEINSAARLFGALFLVQAALLAFAAFRLAPEAAPCGRTVKFYSLACMIYGAAVYPALAILHHGYPGAPLFGVAPCPTVIFTFGALASVRIHVPRYLLPIPVLWAFIGGSAAVLLGVPEDIGLPLSALLAIPLAQRKAPA